MNVGGYIRRAWNLMTENAGPLWGGSLLGMLISSACSFLLSGPVNTGIAYASLKATRNERPELGDVFRGFDRFGDSFLVSLMAALIIFAGTILCIIPGIIAAIGLMYAYSFLADRNITWSEALSSSWNLVKARFWDHLVLAIALLGINILGALACGIGVFVTGPLSAIAITVAYEDLTRQPA